MAQVEAVAEAGLARYTYRLRVSSAARTALAAEWDRCRWVWNECVAKSRTVHLHNKATGPKATCGPAQLDRMLTDARARTPWLRAGASVPQQQVIRDFGRSRAKAQKDIRERLPMARRAGMPKWKTKREALTSKKVVRDHGAIAVEDFRPKFLSRTTMARKAADAAIGATKAALIEMGRKHGRDIRLVHPVHTTMDCAHCDARAKHALPLGERTYTCTVCGAVSPRDKNSARVMLHRAGLNPAGADGARPPGALLQEAA
ncbi:zinc ribbon domain-containing protein [Streptomyces spiralis]